MCPNQPDPLAVAPGSAATLESAKEGDQIAVLLVGQLRDEHDIEELDRIIERQQAAVVHIGWRLLDAAQGKCLDRSVADFIQSVDHRGLEKAFDLEVVHQVVGVVGGGMAGAALPLAEKDVLPPQLSVL